MQSDGNFVCYDVYNKAIWSSRTNGKGYSPYTLIVQDDRNIVVYDKTSALWTSNTWIVMTPSTIPILTPSSAPVTSIPSKLPSLVPTTSPSNMIPFLPLLQVPLFQFQGNNFNSYTALNQTLQKTFTFAAWIQTSTYPAVIVSLGHSVANVDGGEFTIQIDADHHLYFWDYSPLTGRGFSAHGGKDVCSGYRTHIVITRDGKSCAFYINGQISSHATSAASVAYKNMDLVFGVDYRNMSNYFKGTMEHIVIYSQSLSSSQVNYLYVNDGGSDSAANSPIATTTDIGQQSQPDKSGCDQYCVIGISIGVVGAMTSICRLSYLLSSARHLIMMSETSALFVSVYHRICD
eukprot:CAMPEP_0170076480 /NCGR_PEP_ID=MMETSP0019_2-20121128/13470_1 /TAXON_ID=98059 /ORGANISM="Dinobryon sp., Strain UTEXLB2267" /LENGTH=346 /DNA_ID=CAMNT_0010288197 /DNA_START=312 /DNA_END=1352 /DNA_ORIENTATION=-